MMQVFYYGDIYPVFPGHIRWLEKAVSVSLAVNKFSLNLSTVCYDLGILHCSFVRPSIKVRELETSVRCGCSPGSL